MAMSLTGWVEHRRPAPGPGTSDGRPGDRPASRRAADRVQRRCAAAGDPRARAPSTSAGVSSGASSAAERRRPGRAASAVQHRRRPRPPAARRPSPRAGCAACPRRRRSPRGRRRRAGRRRRQQVAALAVGVVDDGVEHRHPAQPRVVGVHQQRRTAVGRPPPRSGTAPAWLGTPSRHGVDQRRASGSASTQIWHMPAPNGPSRSTVGGTRSQPVAATPRTRRPRGRPASRRGSPTAAAPRHRLVDAARSTPSSADRAVEGRVGGSTAGRDAQLTLAQQGEARSESAARAAEATGVGSAAPGTGLRGSGPARCRRVRSAPVAVLAAGRRGPRVERQAAERARRPAGGDQRPAPAWRRPGPWHR